MIIFTMNYFKHAFLYLSLGFLKTFIKIHKNSNLEIKVHQKKFIKTK